MTGTAGEMKVMWVTTDNYIGTEASRVRWGCGSMGKLDKAASGVSYTCANTRHVAPAGDGNLPHTHTQCHTLQQTLCPSGGGEASMDGSMKWT